MSALTTQLANIVCCKPIHIGLCDTSSLGAGGEWIEPYRSGHMLVWSHPWLLDINVFTQEMIRIVNPNEEKKEKSLKGISGNPRESPGISKTKEDKSFFQKENNPEVPTGYFSPIKV